MCVTINLPRAKYKSVNAINIFVEKSSRTCSAKQLNSYDVTK